VEAAERSLRISENQYKAGTTSYLQVITSQTAAFQARRDAVNILNRRITTSVLLIEGLGGGWDASTLPTIQSLERSRNQDTPCWRGVRASQGLGREL